MKTIGLAILTAATMALPLLAAGAARADGGGGGRMAAGGATRLHPLPLRHAT